MAIQEKFPSIRPSLNLDFANTKTLDPRITFSRASTATYYDGKTVAKAEENLLIRSQEFDNDYWTKNAATVTANATTAPDGTSTADALVETTATAGHYVLRTTTFSVSSFTLSVFAKVNGRDFLVIGENSTASGGSRTWFNLNTGAVATTAAAHTASIVNVGNGWYRCSITFTGNLTNAWTALYSSSTDNVYSYTGDGTSGIYIWGAQLEQRSSVTAYTPTTSQPITNYVPVLRTAAANVARFDHNPVTGESLGLLIEEQRTNLLTSSEVFTGIGFLSRSRITGDNFIAPNGSMTASKLVEDTSSGTHYHRRTGVQDGVKTLSVFAKAAERSWLALGTNWASANGAYFDLINGTVGTVVGSTVAGMQNVGGGWWRCWITTNWSSASNETYADIIIANGNNGQSYTGDGFSGVYIWGAQLEAGAFQTSYIPTTTSQVTRSADNAAMTGTNFSSWYRADEGTFLANYIRSNGGSGSFSTASGILSYIANSLNDRIILLNAGSSVQAQVRAGAVSAFTSSKTHNVAVGGDVRAVMAYKTANYAVTANADAPSTGASALAAPLATEIRFGRIGNENYQNGHIRKIAYYPQRLTNTQLQAITK